ncbi:MAG: DUF58 domain-containing protein [Armatimonadetes bacterium]|nr:DUF58 domain-containing protein [Armatimonadota bacterium]
MTLQFMTILTAAGAMAMLALTHNAAAEYYMFAVLVALLLITYASSRLSTRAIRVQRWITDHVYEDEPVQVELEVSNSGRFPRFLLDVSDRLPDFLESDGEHDFMVPTIWPRESAVLTYRAHPRKRGVYSWESLDVSASDPFGVFQRFQPFRAEGEAVVYPRPIELNGNLGRTGVETRGLTTGERSRGAESGLDFYGIRDYQPGDELRRIHWPATAHHGRLTVVEFDRGASENVVCALDARAGTEYGTDIDTSLEVGIRAAASLLHWALLREGEAALAVAWPDGPHWVSVERPEQEYEIFEVLARVSAEAAMPISQVLRWTGQSLNPGTDVYVITAAPDDRLANEVAALMARSLRVTTLLLDAHSFDSRASHVEQYAPRLESLGCRTVVFRRGSNLRETLEHVLARES